MYIILFLLVGVVTAENQNEHLTSSITDFIQNGNNFSMVREIFNNILGKLNQNKASFDSILATATKLASALFPQQKVPEISERWWGEDQQTNSSIRPFKVQFSDEMISDLRARIHNRRNITRALKGAANLYGTNSEYLNYFLDCWANDYAFKNREDWLNKFPQYITNIQGLDIHFIHVKPNNPQHKRVLPLMLLHGWPTTAFEFVHVIEYLQQEREECDFVFEVIVPDLPGYGYSEATNKIGMSQYQMAVIMKNLMKRLGMPRFYVHGGDMGHFVADAMAVLYPDLVMGFHTNFPFSARPQTLTKYILGQFNPSAVVERRYQSRMYPISDRIKFALDNSCYLHQHATRPDNVGHGLNDSPVAQASWVLEIIIVATSPANLLAVDGNMGQAYDMQDWLDSFTVNWASQCMVTSARSYAEFFAWIQDPLTYTIMTTPTPVPFAAIRFRHEIVYMPDDFLRDKYPNLVQALTLDFGGHYAGYENPAVLADSLWTSIKKMEVFNKKEEGILQRITSADATVLKR